MTNYTNEQLEAWAKLNADTVIDRLAGIEVSQMKGDNLAVSLCSYFDNPDQEEGEQGWTPDAIKGYEEVMAAIREHLAPLVAAPALAAALLAERKAREVEMGELRAALKPFVDATVNADLKRLEHDDLFIRLTWPSRKGHTYFADMLPQRFIDARQALKGPTP